MNEPNTFRGRQDAVETEQLVIYYRNWTVDRLKTEQKRQSDINWESPVGSNKDYRSWLAVQTVNKLLKGQDAM